MRPRCGPGLVPRDCARGSSFGSFRLIDGRFLFPSPFSLSAQPSGGCKYLPHSQSCNLGLQIVLLEPAGLCFLLRSRELKTWVKNKAASGCTACQMHRSTVQLYRNGCSIPAPIFLECYNGCLNEKTLWSLLDAVCHWLQMASPALPT